MNWERILGLALVVFGLIVLLWGVLPFGERTHEMDAGPLEMRVEEKEPPPVPPLVGGLVLAAGVGVLVWGARRG